MHRFLKLCINDQQAKAAWHAACKLNNTQLAYHLAHSSIHFDYCHAGHDSSLTDTQRQEKKKRGKKVRLKRWTGCSQWTPISEWTWSLTGKTTFSADRDHTDVWWKTVCFCGTDALKSKCERCNACQGHKWVHFQRGMAYLWIQIPKECIVIPNDGCKQVHPFEFSVDCFYLYLAVCFKV